MGNKKISSGYRTTLITSIKNIVLLLFALQVTYSQSGEDSFASKFRTDISAGYKGTHLTGFSIHSVTAYNNSFGLDLGYGYEFLNSYMATGIYYLNNSSNQASLFLGYGFFQRREEKEFAIKIRTVHTGVRYESELFPNIIVGETITIVKYLDQKFTIPDFRTKQTFEANESNYFEIGIHLGYRFSWNSLF